MKRILSFLLIVVFLHVQTLPLLAKRGGPSFDDSQNLDLVGTYSGVLTPEDENVDPTLSLSGDVINALGLFSLGVPAAGPGTGSFLIFSDGFVYSGTITAVGNRGTGVIKGVLEATYSFVSRVYDAAGNPVVDPLTGNEVTSNLQAQVIGRLDAQVFQSEGFDPSSIASILNSFQILKGTAVLGQVFNVPPGTLAIDKLVTYVVDGVKQSTDVNTGSALTAGGATP